MVTEEEKQDRMRKAATDVGYDVYSAGRSLFYGFGFLVLILVGGACIIALFQWNWIVMTLVTLAIALGLKAWYK